MNENLKIRTMPNGLKMLEVLPINITGIAEAYTTIRSDEMGVSKGHCGPLSANIYKPLGIEEGQQDFRTCCAALGVTDRQVITNRLTASTSKVRDVGPDDLIGYDIYDEKAAPRADGLITQSNEVVLYHYAADCTICFWLDPVTKTIAINHASRQCSLEGIFQSTHRMLIEKGCRSQDITAVLMPSISVRNYEVGTDVAEAFKSAGYGEFVDTKGYDKPHLNLPALNRHILLKECGLSESNVYTTDDMDTFSDEYYFHSYRRGPIDENGRHLNGMNGYFIRLL